MSAAVHELVKIAVGSYSPIPGPRSITFCGSMVALRKSYGVDVDSLTEDDLSRTYVAKDRDGHTWYIRSIEFPLVAFRDRTAEEIVEFEDRASDNLVASWFSSERLRYSRLIGHEMQWLAQALRPEAGQSRQARREFKKELLTLLEVPVDLMTYPPIKLADARARLKPFGLPLKRMA